MPAYIEQVMICTHAKQAVNSNKHQCPGMAAEMNGKSSPPLQEYMFLMQTCSLISGQAIHTLEHSHINEEEK